MDGPECVHPDVYRSRRRSIPHPRYYYYEPMTGTFRTPPPSPLNAPAPGACYLLTMPDPRPGSRAPHAGGRAGTGPGVLNLTGPSGAGGGSRAHSVAPIFYAFFSPFASIPRKCFRSQPL